MQLKPAVTALVTAVALASLLSGCKKEEAAPPAQTPQVGVVTIQPQAYTLTTELPGRTTAFRIAEVRPQVNGIILKRLFKEGADVKEGQQLYQIDPSVYEATLKSAQASLTQTKSITDRYKQLVDEQAVSRQEYDTAVANRMTAEANVQTAQINVRYTKVYAPISGRIGRSAVTEGALVSNGQADAMAVIQQLDPIYVDVTQSSAEMLKLRRDLASGPTGKSRRQRCQGQTDPGRRHAYAQDGKLEFSEVSVDQTTGSVTLRAVFPNPDHVLLPGMFVHAQLLAGGEQQGHPGSAARRDPRPARHSYGADREQGQQGRATRTGCQPYRRCLLAGEKGLNAGDRVITEGLQYVKPGAEVKVTEASNAKPAGTAAAPAAAAGQGSNPCRNFLSTVPFSPG